MRRAVQIAAELAQVETIDSLTGVFENIASMRIGRIKDQVQASSQFFAELWQLYSQLRVGTSSKTLEALAARRTNPKTVFVVITSEGGLSGDIDQRIIDLVLKNYRPHNTDLIVIGFHGVILLLEQNLHPRKFFRLPSTDAPVDVTKVIEVVAPYRRAEIYYQKFLSLTSQRVERITLLSAVRSLSETGAKKSELITPAEFLFEPSLDEVVTYLETVMMEIALGQSILDSRLSQLAARFNAMRQAQERADELSDQLSRTYFRAKRSLSDERIREVIAAMELL